MTQNERRCDHCGAIRISGDFNGTGDDTETFSCGSIRDEEHGWFRSAHCLADSQRRTAAE